MSKFLQRVLVILAVVILPMAINADSYQLPDPGFEDWSGSTFEGEPQLKYWHASNVSQSALGMSFNFNFSHRDAGHTGTYCLMVQDQTVGAAGLTETSPGYASLGYGWQYLEGLNTGSATAGTYGGISFTARPDTVTIWIKRTGDNTDKEDFQILFYSWAGTAKGSSYKNKNGGCTSTTVEDEESDIRIALDGNECKTTQVGEQVAEGWLRDRKKYGQWTQVRIPIYYMNDKAPKKCNLILSASNYPNYRANSGLYEGNSLYVDDVELIYSSKIQTLRIGGTEWKGFDPNSTEEQVYFLPEGTTTIPEIEARRGAGTLSNVPNQSTYKTVNFAGRKLTGNEIEIVKGAVGQVTTITVYAENNRANKTTYKIRFMAAASSNAKLANISYTYTDKDGKQQTENISNFNQSTYNYSVELPYGAQGVPTVGWEVQEDKQTVQATQPTSQTGTAVLTVTAEDGKSKQTYKVNFSVGQLADNTLKDIQVNGKSIPGFTPTQTVYKVSLPVGTNQLTVTPVSAYAAGEQTITITPSPLPTGDAIDGTTVQIAVTTPGNSIAKVYKLNIKLEASSYSYLANLELHGDQIMRCSPSKADDETQINFTPENMTYYVVLKMGTTALPTITWTRGDEYQTVTKTEGGLDGTTRITVLAGNKSDQSVYKIVFSTEKSDRSTLSGIKIDGVALEGFNPDVLNYSYVLPVGTTQLPAIEPIAGDEYQTIDIAYGGVNGKTRITVTAGDGSTSVYQIAFSVATYSVNTLQAIYLDGQLIEGFEPEKEEYWVNLPQGTTALPVVTFKKDHEQFQNVTVREPQAGVLNGDYKLTVRPLSGASRTYIIHFSVATSDNTNLSMIYLDGKPLEGFDPAILHYIDSLPEGVSTIPTVTFLKAEESQRVLSVLNGKQQTITVTAESGAKKEYIIDFIVRVSSNAQLEAIFLDGVLLPGFDKETLSYKVKLTGDRCPVITVTKAPGQQVTITAPYAEGVATISVKPEEGNANTYTITFEAAPIASVQLESIAIDGTPIADFRADSADYTATYEKQLPAITYTKKDASQTITIAWKGNVAWIHVTDSEGNKAAYSITFTRLYSGNNRLEAIYADGVLLPDFEPTKQDYTYELEPGVAYPEIGYKAAENAQVIFFGQLAEGKWGINVAAENGDAIRYTVTYTHKQYTDPQLVALEVENYPLVFDPATDTYGPFVISEGIDLPQITARAKEGQSVVVFNENDTTQQVLVMAENGAEKRYTIRYSHIKSDNVKLANILIDGKSLAGFDPETHAYTVTLPRETAVVPNVNPIAVLDNQTVTTYFSRPNGTTTIEVKAQDGHIGFYTITFPVEQSENTLLKSLKINNEEKDVNVTEYTFNMPFGTLQPYDISYALEDGQTVHLIEADLAGTTKIIVTNEKGTNSRTYSIRYNVAEPQGENKVKNIHYEYINAADETVTGELVPVKGDNVINLPFGAKSFEVTNIEKNYAEQTLMVYEGGIRRGTTIIAVSNRAGEEDITYTLTPVMPAFETKGKLQSLTYDGKPVPNFRPDVYNYIINVTTQPSIGKFAYVAYDDKTVTPSALETTKKQVTFTVDGGETYSVCWFYQNDGKYEKNGTYVDYFDFSEDWEATPAVPMWKATWTSSASATSTKKSTGFKPHGWTVPADIVAGFEYDISIFGSHVVDLFWMTGKEVIAAGTNGAMLSTINGASINGSVPGMMTIGGTMTLTPDKSGGSKSGVSYTTSNFITFRNTPDSLSVNYKALSASNVTGWYYELKTVTGTSTTRTDKFPGDYNNSAWRYASLPITAYAGAMSKYALTINSAHTDNANNMGGSNTIYSSDLQIEDLHFVYNSKLTKAFLDGATTGVDPVNNVFTFNVSESYVGTPALKFKGQVHDQMQTIEWLNDGEWINGELKAKVTNYGENSEDNTVYTVVLKRTPVTDINYTAAFGSYPTTQKGDTLFVNMPSGTTLLPDLKITPASVHQLVNMTKRGNAVTVKVTAEDGADSTTVYVFREVKSSVLDPGYIDLSACTPVDAENFIFSVEANKMPVLDFQKNDGQLIDLNQTKDSIVLTITAEDGVHTRTYTIRRLDPVVATSGKISEFNIGANPWSLLGGDTYAAESNKPAELITFVRQDAQDSVVYIQSPEKMEWQVYGTSIHTYSLTYPSVKSSNAILADILVNGVSLADFDASEFDYTIESDTLVVLEPVAAEMTQKIETSQATSEGEIVVYTTLVTAEDGTQKTYTLTVRRPKSTVATLAGILLDSVALSGFDPNTFDYTIALPLPSDGVKREQPQLPNITYITAHKAQRVETVIGALNGNPTEFNVKSEEGTNNETYTLQINAEKSHCADLTGITVNGAAVDQFEKGRHFYSLSLKTSQFTVDYASDDRFQTVTASIDTIRENHQYNYLLKVQAEDGVTTAQYEVMIYVENQSNDAQLANILLDNKNFDDFERTLNPDLVFDGANKDYIIYLPSGTNVLPEVSAQLKMEGQTVDIIQKADSVLLDVTAVDGTTHIVYVLKFVIPLSTNADLSMIFLDGAELPDFKPDYYFYQVDLPEGVHTLPEVAAQKGEASQTLDEVKWDGQQASIKVHAEDPEVRPSTYVIVFTFTQSDADTLAMIFEDGQALEGFEPQKMYYTRSLPVGTLAFPDISWQEVNDWQTIQLDTVEFSADSTTLIRQIHVTAESGKKNTYTVSYTIEKSSVATLQMIFVDQKQMPGFNPNLFEYYYELSAVEAASLNGALPVVEFIQGDEYQTVLVSQTPDSLAQSLGYKSLVTVTAASGNMNMYTIHYPVEKSTDATLNMINVSGKPLANFDSERFTYKLEIEKEASVPVVSVIKKEEAQIYDIQVEEDTVRIFVTAENTEFHATYTLTFERLKSKETKLRDIILRDANGETFPSAEFPFRNDVYSYIVKLSYSNDKELMDQLPSIECVRMDEEQTIETNKYELPNGDIQVDIMVTAPNGEDQAQYGITFRFIKPSDALLAALYVRGEEFADFRPTKTEYIYKHPYGTAKENYFTPADVTFVLSDTLASVEKFLDEFEVINVVVTAQDGKTSVTYLISQITAEDGDNALAWITINGDTLKDFDPETTFYTYYVYESDMPAVDAGARSVNALDVDITPFAPGDTCIITCTAADNTNRKYYIYFAITTINPGDEAQEGSVMVTRVPGSNQLFVASIRSGVDFALYDRNGKQIYYHTSIPTVEPNNVEVYVDGQNHEVLGAVSNYTDGILVDIIPGDPYFYVFFSEGKKISEGRILFLQ